MKINYTKDRDNDNVWNIAVVVPHGAGETPRPGDDVMVSTKSGVEKPETLGEQISSKHVEEGTWYLFRKAGAAGPAKEMKVSDVGCPCPHCGRIVALVTVGAQAVRASVSMPAVPASAEAAIDAMPDSPLKQSVMAAYKAQAADCGVEDDADDIPF